MFTKLELKLLISSLSDKLYEEETLLDVCKSFKKPNRVINKKQEKVTQLKILKERLENYLLKRVI